MVLPGAETVWARGGSFIDEEPDPCNREEVKSGMQTIIPTIIP
jgi:hypothetical protein